jgi:hypothetical protein
LTVSQARAMPPPLGLVSLSNLSRSDMVYISPWLIAEESD